MPSSLFQRALDSLPEGERLELEGWIDWAHAHSGRSAAEPTDGAQVVANLQSESHLVGDGAFGHSNELTGFLQSCAVGMAAVDPDARHQSYTETCQRFAGRGMRIPAAHLPGELLRYVSSEKLAADLVERMLGKRARAAFSAGALATEAASARLRDRWDSTRLDPSDRLGRSAKVFATFEHSGGAPRHDATALSQALALSCWQWTGRGPELLVELTYPSERVSDPRFPTVAEAEWTHLFRPASEEPPRADRPASCCGWTEPLGGQPAQPEIVHDNAPLAVAHKPPRFLSGKR